MVNYVNTSKPTIIVCVVWLLISVLMAKLYLLLALVPNAIMAWVVYVNFNKAVFEKVKTEDPNGLFYGDEVYKAMEEVKEVYYAKWWYRVAEKASEISTLLMLLYLVFLFLFALYGRMA